MTKIMSIFYYIYIYYFIYFFLCRNRKKNVAATLNLVSYYQSSEKSMTNFFKIDTVATIIVVKTCF